MLVTAIRLATVEVKGNVYFQQIISDGNRNIFLLDYLYPASEDKRGLFKSLLVKLS